MHDFPAADFVAEANEIHGDTGRSMSVLPFADNVSIYLICMHLATIPDSFNGAVSLFRKLTSCEGCKADEDNAIGSRRHQRAHRDFFHCLYSRPPLNLMISSIKVVVTIVLKRGRGSDFCESRLT